MARACASQASVCRSVQAVTYSLLRFVPRHVRFHIRDEMGATQDNFFRSFRIPHDRQVEVALPMPPQVQRRAPVCASQVVRCDLRDGNIAAKAGVALGEPDEDEDEDEEDPFRDGLPDYAAGVESRRRVIASFF
ncbi:unnamed protein product [Arctogadus glacialis]